MTQALITLPHELVLAGPVGSLEAYIGAVRQVPMLSHAEEMALARRFRDDNDLDAARQLVVSQLRFVVPAGARQGH